MLRRLTPLLTIIAAVLFDTAVLPVFYHGVFTVPLTLAVTLCIGLTLGKLRGGMFGMFGGLMIDITAGTLGMMTFFFLVAGFLVALILDERVASTRTVTGIWVHLRRAAVILALYALGETVFCVYRYFETATFEWIYVQNILVRTAIFTAGATLLCPALRRLYIGKRKNRSTYYGKTREVKHF